METKPQSILIVDDELCITHSLSFLFQTEGYECFTALNAMEAEEILEEERPGLIFLDVNMPEKDGYALCRDIRNKPEFKDAHIIMLSAMGQETDTKLGLEAGANEYITKPFDPVLLRKKAKDILLKQ